jgi:phosphoribosylformimino-5-aminoimidazole carboxamide ribotide isomerase
VIGVIDLQGGRAVHARGGQRHLYAPVDSVAGTTVAGDAVALAREYLALGAGELYVADLDAIGGAARQDPLVARLAALGVPLWLDAGASTIEDARQCVALGAARVIVGLETLSSWDALQEICSGVSAERIAFSLDLRNGKPVVSEQGPPKGRHYDVVAEQPEIMAARAGQAGAGAIIVLDLARVGSGTGLDLDLLERVRKAVPGVFFVAGGGVRDRRDLDSLDNAGCDAALVATALQTGTLQRGHVSAAR